MRKSTGADVRKKPRKWLPNELSGRPVSLDVDMKFSSDTERHAHTSRSMGTDFYWASRHNRREREIVAQSRLDAQRDRDAVARRMNARQKSAVRQQSTREFDHAARRR